MMVIIVTGTVSTTVEETAMTTPEAVIVAQEVTTVAAVMAAEMVEDLVAEMEAEEEAEMVEDLVAEMVAEVVEDLVAETVAVQVEVENLDSIETTVHQKALGVVVDVAATIRVNRGTITIADESACAASETGFDILQTRNAAYD